MYAASVAYLCQMPKQLFSTHSAAITRALPSYLYMLSVGELRVGTTTDFRGQPSVSWKHW